MAKKTTKSRATKTSKRSRTADVWFKPVRGSYIPVNDMGWFLYLPFVAYLGFTWYAGLNYTDNYVMASLWIIPNWVTAAVVMTWVAKKTS